MKLKKRRKSSRRHGSRTSGHSAKLNKGSGSHGGKGMAGTGKRADQKKTMVMLKSNPYFGKRGVTSRPNAKKRVTFINLKDVQEKFSTEKTINLKEYKILGEGEGFKAEIIAKAATKSAIQKMEKAGGKIILPEKKKKEKTEKKEEAKEAEKKIKSVKKKAVKTA